MTLTELTSRQRACISIIDGPAPLRQRLVAMGVLRGQQVTLSATSLLGNPRVYCVGRQKICLRREDAACIQIELLS